MYPTSVQALPKANAHVTCAFTAASTHSSRQGLLKRLDITGARWGLQGAEAVLTLRAVIANGDYDDYWRFHLAREHQRLYPGTPQNQSLRVALPLTPNEPHPSDLAFQATDSTNCEM